MLGGTDRAASCCGERPSHFISKAIAQILVWVLVADRSGRTWSSTDFQEWVAISMFCAACLTALAGAVVRRWWVAWAVAVGCFLATALGVAVFVGYAVVNSA